MSALVFLVAFLVLSLLGALVLWLRDRGPRSMEAHMKAFERELHALSPDAPLDPTRRRRPAPPAPPRSPEPPAQPPARPPRPRPGNARPG